ncbi:MAG TPA: DUF2059 domain-containing protein [Azospirillaceae bacterium]|nr:DUF2059 domain-containing protein [Azospirillaceae bacterium]
MRPIHVLAVLLAAGLTVPPASAQQQPAPQQPAPAQVAPAQQAPTQAGQQPAAPQQRPAAQRPAAKPGGQVDEATLDLARKLIEKTGAAVVGQQIASTINQQIVQNMKQANPARSVEVEAFVTDFYMPVLREEIPAMMEEMAKIYARHFTAADLRQIITFYDSPLGRKMLRVTPQIMQQATTAGLDLGQRAAKRAEEEFAKTAKTNGLKVPGRE